MNWEFVIALVIAIPLILLPVSLIWYFNIGKLTWKLKKEGGKQTNVASEVANNIKNNNDTPNSITSER